MLTPDQQRLLAAVQNGFPLSERPFQEIGLQLGLSEETVLQGLRELLADGVIQRTGIVVHHHALGYRANAMVVWDLPDARVRATGEKICAFDFVSLCYVRRRAQPEWPYNFYCMIHGQRREETLARAEMLTASCGLEGIPRQILFSRRRFKQCGARYFPADPLQKTA